MNRALLTRYFKYLDDMRKSGAINMYGASSYLYEEFDDLPSLTVARTVCKQWRDTFNEIQTPAERAAQVAK